ncbi:DUF485 domain-containing protein [Helicobacter baculiformis]|uniref:DUF485 domain-containing protein n=1 Tax=Helicobacter baculiformis TaxID=427351 RepID=A0ABV7ZG01_9HELI|nr:DUF485 domain-containing protein [Helicobacter baculiformis]
MPKAYQRSVRAFREFVSLRNKVCWWLSIIVFLCYYAFVLSLGLFPDVLAYRLGPSAITLGIIAGVFLIVLCIALTGLYAFLANTYFDRTQAEILEQLKMSGALEGLQNGTH